MRIDVYDNNVDQAIRVLKKKMIREGMFREMKKRKFFEKPSERKRRKKAEAVRRLRKKIRRSSVAGGVA
ncbi:MAG: 30S ribosomal protein S21 [Magnetococcus sp. YQC-5]